MNWNLKMLKKYAMFGGIAIALSFVGSAIAYPVTVKLLANAEWLPEGSGVLLSTDKGYVHIYNDNMYELGKSCKTLRNVWYMSACNGILTGHEAKQP